MENETTYLFLRDELQNLAVRQDNILSMAYATVAVIWTLSISIANEWIALLSIIILMPLSLRICDLRYNAVFLGAYLKTHLEDDDDWENIRSIYYSCFPLNKGIKTINYISKLGLPMFNFISCLIFWIIRTDSLKAVFFNKLNLGILIFQLFVCSFLWFIWSKFSNPDFIRKKAEANWNELKVSCIENRKEDSYEKNN